MQYIFLVFPYSIFILDIRVESVYKYWRLLPHPTASKCKCGKKCINISSILQKVRSQIKNMRERELNQNIIKFFDDKNMKC